MSKQIRSEHPEIILASQSPRRQDLLTRMGVSFRTHPSTYDEQLDESRDAVSVAAELGLGKAENVADLFPNAFVIGSDVVIAINGRQMEKAVDIDDAREMLTALSGGASDICTSVAIVNRSLGIREVRVDTAIVYFKPDSDEVRALREQYLALNTWQDKAGAYGIQTGGAVLAEKIVGDYTTILGLPTYVLCEMLAKYDIGSTPVDEPAPVRQE